MNTTVAMKHHIEEWLKRTFENTIPELVLATKPHIIVKLLECDKTRTFIFDTVTKELFPIDDD